uniref:Uncharacterized protein n=1 Tax=Ciona savignyi TaxID=51511 RepID=H2ZBD1_CIOSA
MKVWNIAEYLLEEPSETTFLNPLSTYPTNTPPPTLASWQAHSDCINSISICTRNSRLLIISTSSDCSVALWDIRGNRIGEFGQEHHWTLSTFDPNLAEEKDKDQAKTQADGMAMYEVE